MFMDVSAAGSPWMVSASQPHITCCIDNSATFPMRSFSTFLSPLRILLSISTSRNSRLGSAYLCPRLSRELNTDPGLADLHSYFRWAYLSFSHFSLAYSRHQAINTPCVACP